MYTDIIFIFSRACAIEFQDRVVVTGGWDGNYIIATVQVYNISGAQEQLPSLQTGRQDHACAHYLNNQDRAVSIAITAHLIMYEVCCLDNHFAGSVGDRWQGLQP